MQMAPGEASAWIREATFTPSPSTVLFENTRRPNGSRCAVSGWGRPAARLAPHARSSRRPEHCGSLTAYRPDLADQAPVEPRQYRAEQLAMIVQRPKSLPLVAAHDRGIACDIAEHDRGKLARRICALGSPHPVPPLKEPTQTITLIRNPHIGAAYGRTAAEVHARMKLKHRTRAGQLRSDAYMNASPMRPSLMMKRRRRPSRT